MNWRQGAVAAIGVAAFAVWVSVAADVFRAWVNGTPPSGLSAAFAALSALGTACQAGDIALKAYERAGRK